MQLTKRVLAKLKAPYALGVIRVDGAPCVVSSTEDYGPVLFAAPPYNEAAEIAPGPGGCMALVAGPGQPEELYAIMGCFPGYKFQNAAVYRLGREDGRWVSAKIIGLPFAHRIDFVIRARTRYLVAASLAADKSEPSDWSKSGGVYASPVQSPSDTGWSLSPVLEGIHRNHGFLATGFQGRKSLLISGTEGLFAADLGREDASWGFTRIVDKEVSEIAVSDVDSDGEEELVTIEPFHGDSLRVYKRVKENWEVAWEGELSFGHGLLTGTLGGAPTILVSNRAGTRDLLAFQFPRGARQRGVRLGQPSKIIVDSGVGAANILILRRGGEELVFSTNQSTDEIAAYSATP